MIGAVSPDLDAVVPILIAGPATPPESIDALIDTGYNGILCLPASVIERLGLDWVRQGEATLADGTLTRFDVHEAFIFWNDQAVKIRVDFIETIPLIGMRLLTGCRLTIDVRAGGEVTIIPLAD